MMENEAPRDPRESFRRANCVPESRPGDAESAPAGEVKGPPSLQPPMDADRRG
jgi:hypothetical protein